MTPLKRRAILKGPSGTALLILLLAIMSLAASAGPNLGPTSVRVQKKADGYAIVYRSGDTLYAEDFLGGALHSRGWSPARRLPAEHPADSLAFELQFQTEPSKSRLPVTSGWRWLDCAQAQDRSNGETSCALKLSHSQLPVSLTVRTLLDGTPVFTRWLEIHNDGTKPLALVAVAPWSGLLWTKATAVSLGHSLRDDGGYEGWFGWTPLKSGTNVFRQPNGLTYDDPYFVLRNQDNGQFVFGQLAWPVSFAMEFVLDAGLRFKIGPFASHALRVIAPGETLATPAVHLGCVAQDFDAAVQAMHRHIRRSVLPPRAPDTLYLSQCLAPEDRQSVYRGEAYNETNLMKAMDVAAAAGLELFIVDGPTWAEGYGNWKPKPTWFPHGLAPLREYAHQRGLRFGLYAEPEGGRGDWSQTRAFQEHPKWFEQVILNLAIPAAADYMEAEWKRIVADQRLDLYRHDQNRPGRGDGTVTVRDGFQESDHWRHYEAFYAMTRRLAASHPGLILQQASGGGTRLDLATVGVCQEHYTSDENRYPHVQRMASGMSVYLPPEILVTPNGMYAPHRAPDLPTLLRSTYALGNTPMLFNEALAPDLSQFPDADRAAFLHYAKLYKEFIRPLLPSMEVYHHAPVNATDGVEAGDWFAMQFMSPDRRKGWATIINLSQGDHAARTYLFKPKGLKPGTSYRITSDNTAQSQTLRGDKLGRDGLPVRLAQPKSELLLIEAQ